MSKTLTSAGDLTGDFTRKPLPSVGDFATKTLPSVGDFTSKTLPSVGKLLKDSI